MDLSEPLRTAIVDDATIAALLPIYAGSKTVFTRRPVPDNAAFPIVVISPDIAITDQDGIDDNRPVIIRDVAVYGRNDAASYRAVEAIAYEIRDLFHRRRQSLTVLGWDVVDVVALGPRPAPTDDEQTVGRVVELTVRLAR